MFSAERGRHKDIFVGKKENLAVSSELSPVAANKEVIGLVATEGIKELVILFEQTAAKAIVEGDIEQLKPEDKDIFLYKLECFIGISTICEKPCHHTWKTTIIFFFTSI